VKNATYYAHDAYDYLSELPGFLSSLLNVSTFMGHEPKDRERLSAIWRNLAVVQENRSRLAQNPGVLNALHALASSPSNEDEGFTTRNVINTLISLSMDAESSLILLMHGDGIFSNLMQGLLACSDDTVRKRAARTVRLWASHETSGALLVHCPALMDRVSAKNRLMLIERPIFLETLITITLEPNNPLLAREDACCAIADLAAEKKNRQRMATPELFEALCANTSAPNRREHTVKALVYLTHEEENIPKMVHFPSLLQSLIQYAATAENAIKGPVKHAILLLVTKI